MPTIIHFLQCSSYVNKWFQWFSRAGYTAGQLNKCSTLLFFPSILQKMLKMALSSTPPPASAYTLHANLTLFSGLIESATKENVFLIISHRLFWMCLARWLTRPRSLCCRLWLPACTMKRFSVQLTGCVLDAVVRACQHRQHGAPLLRIRGRDCTSICNHRKMDF